MAPLATTLPATTVETEAIAANEDAVDLRDDPTAIRGMRMLMRRAAAIGTARGKIDTEEVVTVAIGNGIATAALEETTVVMMVVGRLDATATCLMTDAAATDGTAAVAIVKPAIAMMIFSPRTVEAVARLPRPRKESLLPI